MHILTAFDLWRFQPSAWLVNFGFSQMVAKDLQSKNKIERQFGFWQKRLPALFAMELVSNRTQANDTQWVSS